MLLSRIHTLLLASTLIASADMPIEVQAGQPQLFVDDALIESYAGVRRTLHPARKLDRPVVEPDKPWEGKRVNLFGTVLYDPESKLFRMWYNGALHKSAYPEMKALRDPVCYATSKDGIHWDKPALGLIEFAGSKDNNIVYDIHSPSVVIDRRESDPNKRYKMIGVSVARHRGLPSSAHGYWAAYSADGLRWHAYPINPVLPHSDTISMVQHPRTGEFLAFHKRPGKVRGLDRRLVWLSASKDFQSWSEPKLILPPDEQDDAWAKTPEQRMEWYNMSGIPYGSHFLGFITAFRMEKVWKRDEVGPDQSPHDGPIDVQLTYSRDGYTWKRFEDRSPIIAIGKPGTFDGGMLLGVGSTLVSQGDEVHLYYTAYTATHGAPMRDKVATIGRATWRMDGFVSMDAAAAGGTVTTKLLKFDGRRLEVNAAAAPGSIRVELLDDTGKRLDEAALITGDRVAHPVRWKSNTPLSTAKPVRLRFTLKEAQLYSFRVLP